MIEEALRFRSDGLMLEARFSYPDDRDQAAAAVLICPPHPFLGGDMDNNVIKAATLALVTRGAAVLSFNYRGIGRSEVGRDLAAELEQFWQASTCPDYEAEIFVDATNAFAELSRLVTAPEELVVIGYSFGTLPAVAIAQSSNVIALGLISPPLAKWSLVPPARDLRCGLFYAPGDFACPETDLEAFYDALPEPKSLRRFPDADHFFIGHEAQLAGAVSDFAFEIPLCNNA